MKKYFLIITLLFSQAVSAQNSKHCGEIKRMRTWAGGSDTYGVWVEYTSNPASCPGGFYMRHVSDNKNLVYSFLLSAKTSKQRVCIQTAGTIMNGNRCLLNYVMDP